MPAQPPRELLLLMEEMKAVREGLVATTAVLDKIESYLREGLASWAESYNRDRRHQALTLSQAASRLGISRSTTLPAEIANGRIATVPWGPRRVRIPLSEIERLEALGLGERRRPVRRRPGRAPSRWPPPPNADEELAKLKSMTLNERLEEADRRREARDRLKKE